MGEKDPKESKVIYLRDRPEGDRPVEMPFEKGAGSFGDAVMEMVKGRLREPRDHLDVIRDLDDLFECLKASLVRLPRDEFRVLHLSRSKHLIAEEVISKETLDADSAIPRKIAETAVKQKAAAVILVHHHLTDLPMARDEDIELTSALVKACWAVDIPVIDHIIIGRNGLLSMKRHRPEIFEGEDEIA